MALLKRPGRNKITIQTTTQTQDTYGGVTDSWSTYMTAYAEIKTLGGQEFYLSRQAFGQRTEKFVIPYSSLGSSITTKMRINFNSRIFDIVDMENNSEVNKEIILVGIERNI